MADDKTNMRIVKSRTVLARYEAGAIAVAEEGTAHLIDAEVVELRKIVAAYPEKALTLGNLVERWIALKGRLGERKH